MAGMARSTFPLRLSDPALREGVREVAEHEHVSQNEYIESAIRNDLIYRGELRSQQLQAAARRLRAVSDEAYAAVVERSLVAFAEGEAQPDPLSMTALHGDTERQNSARGQARSTGSILDAVAAFRTS